MDEIVEAISMRLRRVSDSESKMTVGGYAAELWLPLVNDAMRSPTSLQVNFVIRLRSKEYSCINVNPKISRGQSSQVTQPNANVRL
ncbi:hypothetical protein L1987_34922 [Smallanthus sonchifolius]|uniref:Uncharacterized protein n=1 Tax=Smallanthus sonchifolius TaxID=185202 RepID=A0ACB9HWD3_9ASTR|nr:hypothetical protein L1987_34922 [Smallanthus sonchifolius]